VNIRLVKEAEIENRGDGNTKNHEDEPTIKLFTSPLLTIFQAA
jgi:hypothetical protein